MKPIKSISSSVCTPEGQEATDGHVNHRVLIPRLRGDLPGNVTGAARCLEATSSVLSHDAADDGEGEAYQHPGAQQKENGGGWQSLGGAAPPVDGVHYTPSEEQGSCGEKRNTFSSFDANYTKNTICSE